MKVTLPVCEVPHCRVAVPPKSRAFFFSSRRRHTRFVCDWSSDVCSSDLDECWWSCADGRPGERDGDFPQAGRCLTTPCLRLDPQNRLPQREPLSSAISPAQTPDRKSVV